MWVKNLNYTSGKKCKCRSWIAHWENQTGLTAKSCKVKGCTSVATDGAHVKLVGQTNMSH